MAPPTYFFPRIAPGELVSRDRLNPDVLRPRKLAGTFADISSVRADCFVQETISAGPGGQAGTLLMALPTTGPKPARCGFYPDGQDWQEFTEADPRAGEVIYWVCLDRDMPPTPDDLVRRNPLEADAYPVELAGHTWTVPVVRDLAGGTGLPQDWLLGPDGTIDERIQADYRELWTEWAAVVDLFLNPADPEANAFQMTAAEAVKRCLQLLGLRYRIGRAEQNLMHLVGSGTFFKILAAGVNLWGFWDVYLAAQNDGDPAKKNGPADPAPAGESPGTGPGAAAGSPATAPAAES